VGDSSILLPLNPKEIILAGNYDQKETDRDVAVGRSQ
jgi:hypothetical protein